MTKLLSQSVRPFYIVARAVSFKNRFTAWGVCITAFGFTEL